MDRPTPKPAHLLAAFGVIAIIVFIGITYYNHQRVHLERHYTIIQGASFTDYTVSKGGLVYAYYQFNYRGKVYTGDWTIPGHIRYNDIVDHLCPVLVDTLAPGNNRLLALPQDFAAIGLSYPDSLAALFYPSNAIEDPTLLKNIDQLTFRFKTRLDSGKLVFLWKTHDGDLLNRNYGMDRHPLADRPFGEFVRLDDSTIRANYYYPDWVDKINKSTPGIDTLFPTIFKMRRR